MKQLIKESVGETTGGDNVRVTFISGNKKFTPDKNKGNLLFTIYEKTLLNTQGWFIYYVRYLCMWMVVQNLMPVLWGFDMVPKISLDYEDPKVFL